MVASPALVPGRYRTVDAYLARLPHGIDSYPDSAAKGSLVVHALSRMPISPGPGDLPEPVMRLVERPPPVSAWVPEVAFNAVALAIYDEHFGGRDVDGFASWVCDMNVALFSNPLYRVLFAFISPGRLVSMAMTRWSAFHRGSSLQLVERWDEGSRLRLEFPPHLFGREMLVAFTAGMRAAALVAGAEDATGELHEASETSAEYSVRWTK